MDVFAELRETMDDRDCVVSSRGYERHVQRGLCSDPSSRAGLSRLIRDLLCGSALNHDPRVISDGLLKSRVLVSPRSTGIISKLGIIRFFDLWQKIGAKNVIGLKIRKFCWRFE